MMVTGNVYRLQPRRRAAGCTAGWTKSLFAGAVGREAAEAGGSRRPPPTLPYAGNNTPHTTRKLQSDGNKSNYSLLPNNEDGKRNT